jgi:Domain of unknown function (DUF4410)
MIDSCRLSKILPPTLGIFAFAALTACAGTYVHDVVTAPQSVAMVAPHSIAIVVKDESTARRSERLEAKREVNAEAEKDALSASLAAMLATRGLTLVGADQPSDLLLTCTMTDARAGSKALRLGVGYGAGKAVLAVDVTLEEHRLDAHPVLLSFDARSTTGSMPGGVSSGDALQDVASSAGAARTLTGGFPRETKQMTAKIDKQLSIYFQGRDWPYTPKLAEANVLDK